MGNSMGKRKREERKRNMSEGNPLDSAIVLICSKASGLHFYDITREQAMLLMLNRKPSNFLSWLSKRVCPL